MELAIVDDNIEVLNVLTEMIGTINEELKVTHFEKAKDCLEYLKNNEVDLLLTDLNLSSNDIKGINFINEVSEFNLVKSINVLTGDKSTFDRNDVSDNTPIDVYEKPIIDIFEFVNLITNSVGMNYKECA